MTIPVSVTAHAGDSSSGTTPNVVEAMMRLSALKARAESVNKAALEIEQQKDALAKEVEEMQRQGGDGSCLFRGRCRLRC